MKPRRTHPNVDQELLAKDAAKLMTPISRRLFLRGSGTLGALALLTGCDPVDGLSAEKMLSAVSRMNDRFQALIFDPKTLAPTYSEADITRPFPFNAFYGVDDAPEIDASKWRLEVGGLVATKRSWSLAQLRALDQQTQITKLICVEGWSAIGKWSGPSLAAFLIRNGADLSAKYVGIQCEDRYWTSLDMATALHPQTQMTLAFDGKPLPRRYGAPLRIRVPTKLGFKNPKHVYEIVVTNDYPGGYWEKQGYNWFSGL